MSKCFADLLFDFVDKKEKIKETSPEYFYLIKVCCEDFFKGVEMLSHEKMIDYFKEYDFTKLLSIDRDKIYISDKDFHIFCCLLTLTIDKYGIDSVIKDLLPNTIQPPKKINLFYNFLRLIVSFFRKTEVKIKEESDLHSALSEAVINLRDLEDRKGQPYLGRGQCFFDNLVVICEIVFRKHAKPVTCFSDFKETLTTTLLKIISVESGMKRQLKEWDRIKIERDREYSASLSFSESLSEENENGPRIPDDESISSFDSEWDDEDEFVEEDLSPPQALEELEKLIGPQSISMGSNGKPLLKPKPDILGIPRNLLRERGPTGISDIDTDSGCVSETESIGEISTLSKSLSLSALDRIGLKGKSGFFQIPIQKQVYSISTKSLFAIGVN